MISFNLIPAVVFMNVYNMCKPVGMGFLQHTPGDLTLPLTKKLLAETKYFSIRDNKELYHMDYVGGRQCKFTFWHDSGVCSFDSERWYDHTAEDLRVLIAKLSEVENGYQGSN